MNLQNISRDLMQHRALQKQVKKEIKLAKLKYKDRVGNMFAIFPTGNPCLAWEGVKSMFGMQTKQHPKSDFDLSNELM